ncbi:Hypothetical protein SCF082_LOCUS2511 [Durusdinium trenchii]|uniref:C3H1-type domain-containing protein n=1 Tax=Durusdinium trenchii TaxID=1381693 RepID=A0ABP0HLK6_9DINO
MRVVLEGWFLPKRFPGWNWVDHYALGPGSSDERLKLEDGLTTPKPTAGEERVSLALSQFCFTEQQVEVETSEQGSTAAATESDNTTPRQTQAKPLSAGSVLHGTGECRPCAWFWKPNGCLNGVDCRHCHDCPPGEVKSRKKGKQAMLRLGLATPKAGSEAHFEALH